MLWKAEFLNPFFFSLPRDMFISDEIQAEIVVVGQNRGCLSVVQDSEVFWSDDYYYYYYMQQYVND